MSASNPSDRSANDAQRWVLAVPWHAVLRWGAPWDRFGLVARPTRSSDAVLALERHYAVVTTADVERTLVALTASAHARDAAWHLTNAVFVAELAFSAYLLDEARAWQAAVDAARSLQRHHRGWLAMAEAYLRGLATHRPESPDEGARDLLTQLFAAPDSPWNTIDWNTPLPERLPPPRTHAPHVLHVDAPDRLANALACAPDGATIRLGPGVYTGAFQLGSCALVRAEHAPVGSVVLEAIDDEPLCVLAGGQGATLSGLVLRGAPDAPALAVHGGFLRIEDCRFEGGYQAIEASPESIGAPSARIVQLDNVVCEGQADSAVTLIASTCRARDVAIHEIGGCGFSCEGSRLRLEEAFIESPDRAGVLASGGDIALSKVRIHDAERWGVALVGGATAALSDVEVVRGIVGLRAADGAVVSAERCRLADATTANVELLDIVRARFTDCHITGGQWAGVWLHPGSDTCFKGGQIGGSRLACVMIEGGRGVALHAVGIGPSHEGGGLFATSEAEVRVEQVFVSGAALAGIELRNARLTASDLRVRGSVEGVLVRDGARLEGRRLDLAEIGGTGLWLADGVAVVDGLGLRKVAFGLVVGTQGVALVRDVVAAHTAVVAQVEHGRLALAGQLTLGAGALRLRGGTLAARGLERAPVSGYDAALHLEAGHLGPLDLQGRSRIVLVAMQGDEALSARADGAELVEIVRNPPPPPITAMTPLLVAARPEALAPWGVVPDPDLTTRLALALVARLGLRDKLVVRPSGAAARIDGALPAVARLAPAFEALFVEPGALGILLAELGLGPRPEPRGPIGLA